MREESGVEATRTPDIIAPAIDLIEAGTAFYGKAEVCCVCAPLSARRIVLVFIPVVRMRLFLGVARARFLARHVLSMAVKDFGVSYLVRRCVPAG